MPLRSLRTGLLVNAAHAGLLAGLLYGQTIVCDNISPTKLPSTKIMKLLNPFKSMVVIGSVIDATCILS